ncbi:5'-methylthioadenosine/S-adenosylhomocysteine nucleosidase family protein [Hyalangium gracile]|uniref:5'-methylthioadenosine/S-adenosylhomocysteine nucleosidase family protein n=1 Tax=Hyalangium gracile TaxID=394092 RepID=UPI001CCA28D2|nr:5'-methylthioadenosine/S-adenosylhomocysteine nucleosidase [Hyalangium gracile]
MDIAVLTVIPAELVAAREALGIAESARFKDEVGTVFYRGRVRSARARRDYDVVLTCLGRAGNALSAAAVQDVITRYRPQLVLLMGIAAGMRGKVRIGEVVFSERVVAYEPAAVARTPEGHSHVEPRPEIRTVSHRVQQDLVHYRPDEARLRERFEQRGGSFPLPSSGNETLYQAHVASRLTVKLATVASGEKLLRDPDKLREFRALHGKTEVAEMEAAGLMEACERSGAPWLVIRGISDFGDEFKDDRFHEFASRAASVVMADFIEHGLELEKRRGPRTMAVAAVALWVAAMGGGVAWGSLSGGEESQPSHAMASEQAGSKGETKPATPIQQVAPEEKPPSSGGSKPRPAVVPQPQSTKAAPEPSSTEGNPPAMKTKIGNVKAGDGAGLKVGNVKGEGSADTQVGDVTCGDNCVLEAGNKEE